jgi:hypothetical protein
VFETGSGDPSHHTADLSSKEGVYAFLLLQSYVILWPALHHDLPTLDKDDDDAEPSHSCSADDPPTDTEAEASFQLDKSAFAPEACWQGPRLRLPKRLVTDSVTALRQVGQFLHFMEDAVVVMHTNPIEYGAFARIVRASVFHLALCLVYYSRTVQNARVPEFPLVSHRTLLARITRAFAAFDKALQEIDGQGQDEEEATDDFTSPECAWSLAWLNLVKGSSDFENPEGNKGTYVEQFQPWKLNNPPFTIKLPTSVQ